MSDLHTAGARAIGVTRMRNGTGSSAASSAAAGNGNGTGAPPTQGVRRNLFQSNLTRRPPISTSASASASGITSASGPGTDATHHLQHPFDSSDLGIPSSSAGAATGTQDPLAHYPAAADHEDEDLDDDIVVRDRNGEIPLGEPPTPSSADGGGGGADHTDDVLMAGVGIGAGVGAGSDDAFRQSEKERRRLAEAVRQHQIGQNSVPAQPDELLEAVRASLRAKVAALAEDNWMFEPEEPPRFQ